MQKSLYLVVACMALANVWAVPGYTPEATYDQKENPKTSKDSVPLSREDAVRESVFKYQVERTASDLQGKDVVFFLCIAEGADPSDALLARVADRHPPVKRVSEAIRKNDGIADKKTGKKGFIIGIASIKWISETEAEVEGWQYEGPLGASGSVYKLLYENGQWGVKKRDMKWIS